ncbi:hypothetical protein ABZ154_12580 [Streptomyces sp. NPDC006261]|uniref:hypothetical protein n=1 Tax=Streptomyces sp. NPDC006261 TaxID=3156739 RepID=UPI0033BAD595
MPKIKFNPQSDLLQKRLRQEVFRPELSGICPMCSKYISKNHSRAVRLPCKLVPYGNGRISYDDGEHYNSNGRPISMHARGIVHERCGQRYLRELRGEIKDAPNRDGVR